MVKPAASANMNGPAAATMYLVAVSLPIYVDGPDTYVPTDWARALQLLRDSLDGRYGEIKVIAPRMQRSENREHVLERIGIPGEDISAVPVFHADVTKTAYWAGAHSRWVRAVAGLLPQADAVHSSVIDPYRPYCYTALRMAQRRGVKTVFVLDQDIVLRFMKRAGGGGLRRRVDDAIQSWLYQKQCRVIAAQADLCLFKGRTTLQRYGDACRLVRAIEDTSYLSADVVPLDVIERRLATFGSAGRPTRFCYCGRLHRDKGVDVSMRLLSRLDAAGHAIEFHIYGNGAERNSLERLAVDLGMADKVVFHGAMPYGPTLLKELARHDLLIFTPRIDETPRMIFDGYAAGLPLVGSDIDYVVERAETDGAVYPVSREDEDLALSQLEDILADVSSLREKTRAAVRAGARNAADIWYGKRAGWTREAFGR